MTREKFKEIISYISFLISGTRFDNHVFCVGGAVRDFVMHNEIKDIDLVIDMPNGGIEFAEWMEKDNSTIGHVVTYPTYGTAMFKLKEYPEIEIECVQTRKEQYKDKNSRNPETCYGTLEEDAFRRDLTINALYYDITNDEIIDPTGKGLDDIKNNVIRVTSTPEIVFFDDGLRLLRVCRFASRFCWEIDSKTYVGMVKNADRLKTITKERIQDELNKMLMCNKPVMAMNLLKDIGLMEYVIPELVETFEMTQNEYHFGTVWEHTMKVLENLVSDRPNSSLEERMAALLHDIGKIKTRSIDENGNVHFYGHAIESKHMSEKILRNLKYSNDFIETVKFIVYNHMITKNWKDDLTVMKPKTLRKLQYMCGGLQKYNMLLAVIDADNKAHAPMFCMYEQVEKLIAKTNTMIEEGTDMFCYKLPIDGNDIMTVKSLSPGRKIKECLDYAMKLAFNDPKIDRETMLKHIKGYKLNNK